MSSPAAHPGLFRASRSERLIPLVLIWFVTVATLVITSGINTLSTDDAMRLVEVRDLLAGQGWFDLTQYRLNPPNGVVMHWSRLIDLPLALLIRTGATVLPTSIAEQVATILWPTTLLLAFFAGVFRLAHELAGDAAARVALIFAAVMALVLQHFRTGAIQHHNVQIVLMIWSLALLVRVPSRRRDGAMAGLAGALSIAIGQEMVPAVATLATIVAARWIAEGDRYTGTTMAYALALATGAIVLAVATIAPADYLTVHCDAISIAQVGALAGGGFGLAALAALPRLHSVGRRLVAAAALAVLLAAGIKFGAPQCLADPYAQLDPRLVDMWLSSVSEARDLSSVLRDLPQHVPAFFGIPLAAVVLGFIRCLRETGQPRWQWIAGTAIQAVLLLVSIWQLRGASGANALGAALVPAALLRMFPVSIDRPAYFGIPRAALIAMLLLNPVTLLALGDGAAHAVAAVAPVATRHIITSGDSGTCQRRSDYTPLALLPRGGMLAFIDSGPFILLESDHAVLAAPYHRNQAGNIAMLDMFLEPPAAAKIRMDRLGIDYVAFCPDAPERYQYVASAPAGLAAALSRDNVPSFLERIQMQGTDLAVYRVRH